VADRQLALLKPPYAPLIAYPCKPACNSLGTVALWRTQVSMG